jgi:Tfp pilus assembly protein PilO
MALILSNPQFKKLTETPQRKTYTVVFATLILIILMIFLAVRPAIGSIFNRTSENKAKNDILTKMDTKYQNLQILNNERNNKNDSLVLLDEAMPQSRQEEFLVANVKSLAQESDLQVTAININRVAGKSILEENAVGMNTKVSGVGLEVRGRRTNINNFVEKLENFPKILNIRSVVIMPTGGAEFGASSFNGNIQAEFYYYSTEVTQ